MAPLNNDEDDSLRLEVIFTEGVFLIKDPLLIAAEVSPAANFLPVHDFLAGYDSAPRPVANFTAERILAPLTELFPAALFIVRKVCDIRAPSI